MTTTRRSTSEQGRQDEYTLRTTNVDSSLSGTTYSTLTKALHAGRKAGFEFTVWDSAGRMRAAWTVFGGTRFYNPEPEPTEPAPATSTVYDPHAAILGALKEAREKADASPTCRRLGIVGTLRTTAVVQRLVPSVEPRSKDGRTLQRRVLKHLRTLEAMGRVRCEKSGVGCHWSITEEALEDAAEADAQQYVLDTDPEAEAARVRAMTYEAAGDWTNACEAWESCANHLEAAGLDSLNERAWQVRASNRAAYGTDHNPPAQPERDESDLCDQDEDAKEQAVLQLLHAAESALEILPPLMDRLDEARGVTGDSDERAGVARVCSALVAAIQGHRKAQEEV